MTYSIILGIIFILLFGMAFLTRRRFGVLVLALLAGQALSDIWASEITQLVARSGFSMIKPPLHSVVALGIILLPALILLASGPIARKKHERLFGSLIFAVTTVILAFNYINDALVADDLGRNIQQIVGQYQPVILTICIILALIDVLAIHTKQKLGGSEHHGKSKHHH